MLPPPGSPPSGAEWLSTMPTTPGETPPKGFENQPVKEYIRLPRTGRVSKKPTQVVQWLYAEVTKDDIGTGTPTDKKIRKWVQDEVGLPTDDAGHIIGNAQGGLGTVEWNIFPQSSNFNRGVFSSDIESQIRNEVLLNGTVKIWFLFHYEDAANPARPDRFNYFILYPSGTTINNDLLNPIKP